MGQTVYHMQIRRRLRRPIVAMVILCWKMAFLRVADFFQRIPTFPPTSTHKKAPFDGFFCRQNCQ